MDCEAAEPIGFSKQGMMVPISCLQKYPIIFGKICNQEIADLQKQLDERALHQRFWNGKGEGTNPRFHMLDAGNKLLSVWQTLVR